MEEILSQDGWLNQLLAGINDWVWSYALIGMLVVCGLWFTWKNKFVQIRMLPEMIRLLTDRGTKKAELDEEGKPKYRNISSFQAFAVSIATRVGTGNLAGVATAIAVGGPGAVFWMWIIAFIGAATAYVESTLAQLFKEREKDSFVGGPAYYILKGMQLPGLATLFAVLITLTFGLSYNAIQSNTICAALNEAFGTDSTIVGIVIAAVALFIVFGGIQRVAKVSSVLVPLMAGGYFLLTLVIIAMNVNLIPDVFRLIIENAFGVNQAIGGTFGVAIVNGIKRGLFSNEAGEGSAPNVAATADVSHPVKQGLIQSLGVFTDTIIVCTCTAFIILLSGVYQCGDESGIQLTQMALESQVGSAGPVFVALAICMFAFSSIIGNYYYGEVNVRFLTKNKYAMFAYRLLSGGLVIIFGAVSAIDLVWNIGDFFMALLTAVNLLAILILGNLVFRMTDDYIQQKRSGISEPEFHRVTVPEVEDEVKVWPL